MTVVGWGGEIILFYNKTHIVEIINKLTNEELSLLCDGGEYAMLQQVNSPFVTFRKVHMVGQTPVAFIDGIETIPGVIHIAYATIPECQNLGISSLLISELIDFYKFRKPLLRISTKNVNLKTIHLCNKFEFRLLEQKMFTSEYIYIYKE